MRRFLYFVSVLLPVAFMLACSKVPSTPVLQGKGIPHWLELPETTPDPGLDFYSRDCKISGKHFRNYSFYWDYSNRVSHWVAYPLNNSYFGDARRFDAWGYDPLLPAAKQQNICGGYKIKGDIFYWRGQQLPDGDRTANEDINATTFYGTIIVPMKEDFNNNSWPTLEGKIRSWAINSDTLYVVSGCVVEGSTTSVLDCSGANITVPVAFYKAVLRYSKNSTVGTSGYMGAAFWYDHEGSYTIFGKDQSMSIAALEKKLGYGLFVNLSRVTGESAAKTIKNENPASKSWWWQ